MTDPKAMTVETHEMIVERLLAERDHAVKWAEEEGERAGELAGQLLDTEAERDQLKQKRNEACDERDRAVALYKAQRGWLERAERAEDERDRYRAVLERLREKVGGVDAVRSIIDEALKS